MDRAVRIADLWNWLPAFRILAETQHLPTAAKHLRVTGSSVSRSIKLLEENLGYRLFERSARGLRLNADGEALLEVVREAMRRIDDGIIPASTPTVRVAGGALWLQHVLVPSIRATRGMAQSLIDVVDVSPLQIGDALLRGDVDVALCEGMQTTAGITVTRVTTVTRHLCHGPALTSSLGIPHAVCTSEPDVWPPELPRTVSLRAPNLGFVIAACASGTNVAVLPEPLARMHGLVMASEPLLPGAVLHLAHRSHARGEWSELLEQVRRRLVPADIPGKNERSVSANPAR